MSYPDIYTPIKRHEIVSVSFVDESGKKVAKEYRGFEAVVVQHEIDHTNGICLVGDFWRKQKEDADDQQQDIEAVASET